MIFQSLTTKKQTFLREMSQIIVKEVFHLMTSSPTLCTLQFAYALQDYQSNLATLTQLIEQCPKNAIILAPELCLSGYSYDHMVKAALFSQEAIASLSELSQDKIIGLTLITQRPTGFYNTFMLFHKQTCIYQQDKAKLFALGDETKYFQNGDTNAIRIIEVEGIKIAVLICFEIRFTSLWEQVKGADIILVPAFWAASRKAHFEALSNALAVMNQAYVMCANSADKEMAKSSGIILPSGVCIRDDSQSLISCTFDPKEIKTMRRYINVGLD